MINLSANERQARAIHAAQVIAQKYGVQPGRPVILKDTNNTIVHLAPEPIVAKVSVEKRFRQDASSLEREVVVAGILAEAGAPVVRPTATLPPGPHYLNGVEVSFWELCPHDPNAEISVSEAGRALRVVHDSLNHMARTCLHYRCSLCRWTRPRALSVLPNTFRSCRRTTDYSYTGYMRESELTWEHYRSIISRYTASAM